VWPPLHNKSKKIMKIKKILFFIFINPGGYIHPEESGPEVIQGPGGVTTFPRATATTTLPREKAIPKNEWQFSSLVG